MRLTAAVWWADPIGEDRKVLSLLVTLFVADDLQKLEF